VPAAASSTLVFLTDGTFEGLLTAVFEAYARKLEPALIRSRQGHPPGLFEECVEITTETDKAERVWKGFKRHLGLHSRSQLHQAFLSREPEVETLIYHHIRLVLPGREATRDAQAPAIHLAIECLSQKVRREAHRMKGLVRFAKMENDFYLALVNPRYDILPLIRRHFEKRYADQHWLIFDTIRNYGLLFDTQRTQEVRADCGIFPSKALNVNTADEACRQLWKTYFVAVNIAERRNPKLHLRHLPRRYWHNLPEKN
jgi:probable DNA metabolism protein